MSKLFQARRSVAKSQRGGLTLLEVIFAMMVLLVGLVSVGLLIPLAGRQAADSYQITQGLAAGESAMAMVSASELLQPTSNSAWFVSDLPANTYYKSESLGNAYGLLGLSVEPDPDPDPNPNPPSNSFQACEFQNRASGYGFCLDPLFWGNQRLSGSNSLPVPLPAPFTQSMFPCLSGSFDPREIGNPSPLPYSNTVPRLIRVSLWNPAKPAPSPAPSPSLPVGYLPAPAASKLTTIEGGDLVQLSPDVNKALGPLRLVYANASTGALLKGAISAETPSWLMTLTPAVTNPMQPVNITERNFVANNKSSNRPVRIPKLYDAAVVVFAKRDVRDINPDIGTTAQNFPVSERILRVAGITTEALTSGTFNLTLEGSSNINPRIKVGDWLMLSRWTQEDLPPYTIPPSTAWVKRQVHRWYRIVSVSAQDTFPVTVRVAGPPWNWTEFELEAWGRWAVGQLPTVVPSGPTEPPGPTTPFLPSSTSLEVHATLLKDVVHVYERQIEMQ